MKRGALTECTYRLSMERGIFSKEELLERVRGIDQEMKRGWSGIVLKWFAE
jgi:hypothetical protein